MYQSTNPESSPASQEANRFVQSALDAMSSHISILNQDGEIIGVNKAWREFADANNMNDSSYGIGLNYLTICDNAARLNSKEAAKVAQGIRDVMSQTVEEFELEYPCHSSKDKRWFLMHVSRFHWYDAIRYIVSHQNIAELKQLQIKYKRSQQRIQTVLDNINNAIITLTQAGKIESTNQASSRIFGYAPTELEKMNIADLLAPPLNDVGAFRLLNHPHGHELHAIHKDGAVFPIYYAMNRIKLDDRPMYSVVIRDMSHLHSTEAALYEVQKTSQALEKERELREIKNRFLSMMSHEFRTPLASLRLSHDMLKHYRDKATPEENEQYLDNILVQVNHLSEIVSDVITLSKTERAELEFEPEATDLITFCRDVFEEFQLVHYSTHDLRFDCSELILSADIDKKLMRRALSNLLSNAIKYSPNGGTVEFRLQQNGDVALIEVADCGIGIPERDHERLFGAFHRAKNVGKLPGTGLGLAIAQQAIERHDGSITFISEEGVGTTFTLVFPLKQTTES